VVTLTLNRPQAFNSLSEAMLEALQAALHRWPKTAVHAWW
jgi:enoyl-CoA hydratase/carnithine racemase